MGKICSLDSQVESLEEELKSQSEKISNLINEKDTLKYMIYSGKGIQQNLESKNNVCKKTMKKLKSDIAIQYKNLLLLWWGGEGRNAVQAFKFVSDF